MEYLDDIHQPTSYDAQVSFTNIISLISGIYGAPNIKEGSFAKVADLAPIMRENSGETDRYLINSNLQTSGVRLILKTNSTVLALKAWLKRAWAHQNLLLYNSSGFDIYQFKKGKYVHVTVIAPEEGHAIFAHQIIVEANAEIVIYFPTFNALLGLFIGVTKGCTLSPVNSFYCNDKAVVFYGNSCTQGASASRSGNAYPNIISRILNYDIINYSFSGACRAELAMAAELLKNNMTALIIDYQRNAVNLGEFYRRYYRFYSYIREKRMDLPIILVGGFNAVEYNKHIKQVFNDIKLKYKNTFYIDLTILFKDIDCNYITADNIHYTDIGMYLLAEKIAEYLNQVI